MIKIILLLVFLATSCISTEVVGIEPTTAQIDTTTKSKPHKPPRPPDSPKDTTERQDTTRKPMGFNPTVEGWNETEIEINT